MEKTYCVYISFQFDFDSALDVLSKLDGITVVKSIKDTKTVVVEIEDENYLVAMKQQQFIESVEKNRSI